MSKNTFMAFALILGAVWFFNSNFYYDTILKQPHPSKIAQQQMEEAKRKAAAQEAIVPPVQSQSSQQSSQTTALSAASSTPQLISSAEQNVAATVLPADSVTGDTIVIETNRFICRIAEKGARIISLKTKDYHYIFGVESKKGDIIELVRDPLAGWANLSLNAVSLDAALFTCSSGGPFSVTDSQTINLDFVYTAPDGNTLTKQFRFAANDYDIGISVISSVMDGKKVALGIHGGIAESEAIEDMGSAGQYLTRRSHIYNGNNVEHLIFKKEQFEEETGDYHWVGVTSKYFLLALIPDSIREAEIGIQSVSSIPLVDKKQKPKAQDIDYRIDMKRFASGTVESYRLYAGPSQLNELKRYDIDLQKVLFSGWAWFLWAHLWFPWICEFVLWLLIVLQGWFADYGVVIIMLTLLSRIVTYPLTQSSMKSMSRMKDLQPKVAALREKHKSNPKKMNEQMMALYKKEGVNPMNPGCLPLFLQMPVFIALFMVLQKAIELRGVGTFLLPWVHDLSKPECLPIPFLSPLPFEIPMYGKYIALLPILNSVIMYFQNKATIKDPNQKFMIWFMPIFMLVLFNNFPVGLNLYWTFSSAIGLLQQKLNDRASAMRQSTVQVVEEKKKPQHRKK